MTGEAALLDCPSYTEYPEFEPDEIRDQTNFYTVTTDNAVIFPRWEKITFSDFFWDYFRDDSMRELLCIGRGAGKTYMVLLKKLVRAFINYAFIKASGIRYSGAQWHLLIVVPKLKNAKAAIGELLEMVPKIPGTAPDGNPNYRYRSNKDMTDWRLFGDNELMISVTSSFSASAMRGLYADDLFLDEACMVRRSDVTDVLIQVVQRQGRPSCGGYFTCASTPDTEDLLEPWFDASVDEADPDLPEKKGFFDDFTLWEADFAVNPVMSDALFERIMREKMLNEGKFKRERLGIRHLVIDGANADGTKGNVIYEETLVPCYYMDKVIPTDVVIAIDMAFGNTDSLARIFYDKTTGKVFDLDIWHPKEQNIHGINPGSYDKGIVQMFIDTAAMWPGAPIVFDANSESYAPIAHLVPRHLRTVGIKKNNAVKNGLVQTLLERLAQVDQSGINTSIQFPSLAAPWLTAEQKEHFKQLYTEMVNYRKIPRKDKLGNVIGFYYTKVSPYTDDAIDALLLLMTQSTPQKQVGPVQSLTMARRRGRGW